MAKLVLCVLLAFYLAIDTCCLKLDECPPGYRCRPKMFNRIRRSLEDQDHQQMDVEKCEPGTFSPGGAFECTPCKDGTYTADSGAAACHVCPQGHMCPHTNKVPELCPTGTYNNLTQQTCCRTCPRGKYAQTKGMFQCFDCQPGYKCESLKKLPCEEKG